jgi:hypothetical protein
MIRDPANTQKLEMRIVYTSTPVHTPQKNLYLVLLSSSCLLRCSVNCSRVALHLNRDARFDFAMKTQGQCCAQRWMRVNM